MSKHKEYTVYFHTNIDNNKVYVGITCQTTANRWGKNGKMYLRTKKNGDYFQPKFARAILSHGWDRFEHIIFAEGLTKAEACFMEMSLINLYNSIDNGYNITKGGEGGHGIVVSEEERKRRSKKFKGKHLSPNTEFKKGHIHSEEVKAKLNPFKPGHVPWNKGLKGFLNGDRNPMKKEENKAKLRGTNNYLSKKVKQIDMNGNVVRIWDYMSQAQEELCFYVSNITKCCKGKIKSAYGYKWEYA